MSRVLPAQEIVHVQGPALARVQRADALVDFGPQRVEFLHVGKQLAADLFLICVRQPGNLCNSLFERSNHQRRLAHSISLDRETMERAKGIEPSYAAWEAAVLPLNYARKARASPLISRDRPI